MHRRYISRGKKKGRPCMAMLEDPQRSYDPGYAAGATLRRSTGAAGALQSDTMCEQGLAVRLESWAAHHFARLADTGPPYRHACREHFRRGFRDGYWGRARARADAFALVAREGEKLSQVYLADSLMAHAPAEGGKINMR